MSRDVRLRVTVVRDGAEQVLGEAEGRAADLIALLVLRSAAVNRPGVRRLIINQTHAGLRMLVSGRID